MKVPDWMLNPPSTLKGKIELLQRKKGLLRSPGKKGKFLRQLLKESQRSYNEHLDEAKAQEPLAFFKPSYEQALMLNSWMYGIAFICVYCANRVGKTTCMIVDKWLWIFPNDPKWQIFTPYRIGDPILDPENKGNPREGQLVQVFPRPDISALKKIKDALKHLPASLPKPNPKKPHYDPDNAKVLQWLQTQVPEAYQSAFPYAPWNSGGTIWFGAPDQDHHEQVMFPLLKQYLPKSSIDRYVPSDREITIKVQSPSGRITIWELIGKSYESKDTKWSSGAVDIIMLTEGIKPDILKEVKLRFKDPGIGSHDFTPYLPANSGAASFLAQRIARGQEILPLSYFVYTGFTVYDAPAHIMSKDKRDGLIESYKDDPEGRARLEGEFYASSMLVLSNLSRDMHLLPWSVEEMFQRYPNGRIYRGLDPGLDHPTACTWGYLLPFNVWIIYRIFSQAGLGITERCEKIVKLSNNALEEVKFPGGSYKQEVHPYPNSEIVNATYCDYHTFKQDETTGLCYATNYQVAGLSISESVHTGPEDRAILFNTKLKPDPFTPHLLTGKPPGPQVYFLKDGLGVMQAFKLWEEFYWDRKKSGEDKGMPKDKIPVHGDDELDSSSYIVSTPLVWTRFKPSAKMPKDNEPEEYMMSQTRRIGEARQSAFATVAKPFQPQQVVVFGDPSIFKK